MSTAANVRNTAGTSHIAARSAVMGSGRFQACVELRPRCQAVHRASTPGVALAERFHTMCQVVGPMVTAAGVTPFVRSPNPCPVAR